MPKVAGHQLVVLSARLRGPSAYGSLDAFHAAGFPYQHVLAGHGRPLVNDARTKVLRALEKVPRPRARSV